MDVDMPERYVIRIRTMDREGFGMASEYHFRQGKDRTEPGSAESNRIRHTHQHGQTGVEYDHGTVCLSRLFHSKRLL